MDQDESPEPFQPDLERIRSLIRLARERGLSELTVEEAGERITVRLRPEPVEGAAAGQSAGWRTEGAIVSRRPFPQPVAEAREEAPEEEADIHIIVAPMAGIFYRSPGPDSPSYVIEGQEIDEGETIGLIESMKIFNEIQSEQAGEVIAILAENEEMVNVGQPLVRLRLTQTVEVA